MHSGREHASSRFILLLRCSPPVYTSALMSSAKKMLRDFRPRPDHLWRVGTKTALRQNLAERRSYLQVLLTPTFHYDPKCLLVTKVFSRLCTCHWIPEDSGVTIIGQQSTESNVFLISKLRTSLRSLSSNTVLVKRAFIFGGTLLT